MTNSARSLNVVANLILKGGNIGGSLTDGHGTGGWPYTIEEELEQQYEVWDENEKYQAPSSPPQQPSS